MKIFSGVFRIMATLVIMMDIIAMDWKFVMEMEFVFLLATLVQ